MKFMLLGAIAATLTIGLAGAAFASPQDAKAPAKQSSCFLESAWQGWHAPDEKTVYLRVNGHDIYRLDLSSGAPLLTWGDAHLVNIQHGSSWICTPLDLQLSVKENGGIAEDYLFIKTMTKLTPDEVAAIPKKDLP